MFVQDPFDIAPRARRHTPAAWAVLVVGVAFALFSSIQLTHAWTAISHAEDELFDARQALRSQALKDSAAAAGNAREPADGLRARLELQRMLNLSWSGLFEILEAATKAVDGRVTISTLAPVKLRPEGAEISITALAATSDAMLQYLRALQADQRVRQVQLVSQQPATVGSAAVLRFQVSVLVDRPGAATLPAVAMSQGLPEGRK